MNNLPVNRLSTHQRPPTGVSPQPGVGSKNRKQSGGQQAAANDNGGITLKVERHGHWASMSRTQSQLSRLQSAEQAIVASYRELLSLGRQMENSNSKSDELAAKVTQLRQKLEQGKSLDNNLKLKQAATRASYLLERVDLLSARNQSEQLSLQLPNGAGVDLNLPANASPKENLQQLNRVFGKHGLKASITDDGTLRVNGKEELLSSPWVFRGQGVRVPAGNPVPIQLGKEPDDLSRLAESFQKGSDVEQQRHLRQLLATLERERRTLEAQRQQLLAEIARLEQRKSRATEQREGASAAVRDALRHGDFTQQLATLLAQANVSRSTVVSILGR